MLFYNQFGVGLQNTGQFSTVELALHTCVLVKFESEFNDINDLNDHQIGVIDCRVFCGF